MNRASLFAAPFFALGAASLGAAASTGCSAPDPETSRGMPHSSATGQRAAADDAIRHDVAWAAAATARCSQPGSGAGCAALAKRDVASLAPMTLRTRGVVADVLAALPTKAIICAIVHKVTSPKGDSDAGADADAGAQAASHRFDMHGAVVASGDAKSSAELNVVWDLERCQAAAFVLGAGGGGLGAAADLAGFRGSARGSAGGAISAGVGSFVRAGARGEGSEATHFAQLGTDLLGEISLAEAPSGMPAIEEAFLTATLHSVGYMPWEAGTRALAGFPTGRAPRVVVAEGGSFVQYEADVDSATTCGAQMAVAKLVQASDPGDFTSPAGEGALTAIASGVARSLGVDLDTWCGDASGAGGPTPSGGDGDSCVNHDASESYCGSASCTVNGNGLSCCRSEPTGTIPCYGMDSQCPAGLVCSLRTKNLDANLPIQICVQPEPCLR